MNRLKQLYQDKIVEQLKKDLGVTNNLAVPKLSKIIVNIGIGDAGKDKQIKEKILNYMGRICGQKAQFRPAKKSIAEFSIRQGDAVGIRTILRGERMYEFLDKLLSIVLPRVRDFSGISLKAFDNNGNYNLGLSEQIIFPEVDYDTIDRVRGLQITINTTAKDKASSLLLLKYLGVPFEKDDSVNSKQDAK